MFKFFFVQDSSYAYVNIFIFDDVYHKSDLTNFVSFIITFVFPF